MFLLKNKNSIVSSGLLHDFTDIHSHLLPNIDDGEKNFSDSIYSLQWLYNVGIRRIFFTPHIMSEYTYNTKNYIIDRFNAFVDNIDTESRNLPQIQLCAEYMFEPDFIKHKKDGLLTFSNKHVLIETSYLTPPFGFFQMISELMEDGYYLILAHPERYIYMTYDDYKELKRAGVFFQLNILSLTGSYGDKPYSNASYLLKNELYDFVGTDFHNLNRHEFFFHKHCLSPKVEKLLSSLVQNNNFLW